MKRKQGLLGLHMAGLLLALTALSLAQAPHPAAAKSMYSSDFEQDLKPWAAGWGSILALQHSDSLCPVDDGHGMALVATPERARAQSGRLALGPPQALFAYMATTYPVRTNDRITVEWAAKPANGCETAGTCAPAVAIGPTGTPDGLKWALVKGQPAPDGWMRYQYSAVLPATDSVAHQAAVALGVTRFDGKYGFMALGIDCVQVRIQPDSH